MGKKAPTKPWVKLLEPDWQAWRELQFMKGEDPDHVLESMLEREGKLPPDPARKRNGA